MRKKVGFILLGISLVVLAIGGGTWHYLEQVKQDKKEEAIEKREEKKLIQKSAREIDDFYKWNYIGVEKTNTGKLWENPASGELELNYTIYIKGGRKIKSSANWEKDKIQLDFFGKDSEVRPEFKVPESGEYTKKSVDYLLEPHDIKKLKKKGYTSSIPGQQIKKYLYDTYPEKFN